MTPDHKEPPLITPSKAPINFLGYDFTIAAECMVNTDTLLRFNEIEQATDELGLCQVLHLHVNNVAAYFYRSEQYVAGIWVLFIDICGCGKNPVKATTLTQMIFDTLGITGPIWINKSLDKEVSNHTSSTIQNPIIPPKGAATSTAIKKHNQVKKKKPKVAPKRIRRRQAYLGGASSTSLRSKYRTLGKKFESAAVFDDKDKEKPNGKAMSLFNKIYAMVETVPDPGMYAKAKAKNKRTKILSTNASSSIKKAA